MVMGIVVRCEHDQDRTTQPAVDMISDYSFKNRTLEDTIKLSLIVVEVVPSHWVGLRIGLRLWHRCSRCLGRRSSGHLRCPMRFLTFARTTGPVAGVWCAEAIGNVSLLRASLGLLAPATAFRL